MSTETDQDLKIETEWTPNPNALKFVTNRDVRPGGKATFSNLQNASGVPLAQEIFYLPYVQEVHFFENVITVSQNGGVDWSHAEKEIKDAISRKMLHHDPYFPEPTTARSREGLSPELLKIEEILDRTIRPGLQGDGGDLDVISLEGKKLSVSYQGACGSCPSSIGGTLMAIQGILRDEYDPDLEVVTV
jgi:Fe-S cluster biogenesis protein NfuA